MIKRWQKYMHRILTTTIFFLLLFSSGQQSLHAQEDSLAFTQEDKLDALDFPDSVLDRRSDPVDAIKRYVPDATKKEIEYALSRPSATSRGGILLEAFGGRITYDERKRIMEDPNLSPDAIKAYAWRKQYPQLFDRIQKFKKRYPNAKPEDVRKRIEVGRIPSAEIPPEVINGLGQDLGEIIRKSVPNASDKDIQNAAKLLERSRTTGALHEAFPTLSSGQLKKLLSNPGLSAEAIKANAWLADHPMLAKRIDDFRKKNPGVSGADVQKAIEQGKINTVEIPEDVLKTLNKKTGDPKQALLEAFPDASEAKIKEALSISEGADRRLRLQQIFQTATIDQVEAALSDRRLDQNNVSRYEWKEKHPFLTKKMQQFKRKNPKANDAQVLKYLDELRKPKSKKQNMTKSPTQTKPIPRKQIPPA